ncbi:winged helix-turn-helix transcriptional regulator [Campylobacter sp. FMV-PI01]|uniref:Winged helix-turn-helix transcriptional regulator n=1 Tax=Campylobacter portucalensis TaxID=2608384 RepID=A0A6L5WHB3_9BACT|nr:metalloregulator ArsR/SmtB family transcription factor [Campylobacter portucalensis]MSN96266.1 winged helix-turn-helix transcriptional regulator [Campylobacter portucalensis]
MSDEICSVNLIHEDIVKEVAKKMPDEIELSNLADFFKVFSDSTRVKILWALYESEMCVCDIAALLNMSGSSISHQLRTLKQNKFVKNRRDGKVVYYSLIDEHISFILKQGLIHISRS